MPVPPTGFPVAEITTSPFSGPPDWWSYAISAEYRELFAGAVAPDLAAELTILAGWDGWADYVVDLHNRAAAYGGETNAQRLVKVLALLAPKPASA